MTTNDQTIDPTALSALWQPTRAGELQSTDPAQAALLWERIDRQMTDQAPWVPLLNDRRTDFLARRVGNYQHHPQWGMLVDQLWLR